MLYNMDENMINEKTIVFRMVPPLNKYCLIWK